jgi:mono/diheme cytochrome c family protein
MSAETKPNVPESAPAAPSPTENTVEPIPVWLIVLIMLLVYWGMVYFDHNGGWFNRSVYSPYVSYEQVANLWPKDPVLERMINGKKVFEVQCAICHMKDGVGNPGNGCPPLAGSEWVAAPGIARIVRITSKGVTGPIEVKGQTYNSGNTMTPIGDSLPGDEDAKAQTLADILLYVRRTFGGRTDSVDPAKVLAIRKTIASKNTAFTVEELKLVPEAD